jgi:DNA-binding winged helix-turn-helix (wHTH) protein
MPGQNRPPVYKFGAWEIDLARREMRLNGVPTDLGSRAFEIVETLVQSAGELIDKYDLMNRIWPGAAVEETPRRHKSPRYARRWVPIEDY